MVVKHVYYNNNILKYCLFYFSEDYIGRKLSSSKPRMDHLKSVSVTSTVASRSIFHPSFDPFAFFTLVDVEHRIHGNFLNNLFISYNATTIHLAYPLILHVHIKSHFGSKSHSKISL